MRSLKCVRGDGGTTLLIVLGVVALVGVFKPSLLPGHSKRAAQSQTASAKVEAATAQVDYATEAQAASAAASVTAIGRAAGDLPPSPATDFVRLEVPAALAKLPKPDLAALLDAEKRRSAVMEGRHSEAARLYEREAKRASELQRERDEAFAARDVAQAGRREVDGKLVAAAAAEHARTLQLVGALVVGVVGFAGWLWAKRNGISLASLGDVRAKIFSGISAVEALDDVLTPAQKRRVRSRAVTRVGEQTLAAGDAGRVSQ